MAATSSGASLVSSSETRKGSPPPRSDQLFALGVHYEHEPRWSVDHDRVLYLLVILKR